jgi:hypothetical protein
MTGPRKLLDFIQELTIPVGTVRTEIVRELQRFEIPFSRHFLEAADTDVIGAKQGCTRRSE